MRQDYKGDYVQVFFQKKDGSAGNMTARIPAESIRRYCKEKYSKGWKRISIQRIKNPWQDITPEMVTMNGRYSCD